MATKNAQPSAKPHFSARESVDFGFETVKSNFFFFITLFVVVILTYAVMGILQGIFTVKVNVFLFILVTILRLVVNFIVSMGLIKIALIFIDKKKAKISDLFYTKSLLNFFLVSVVEAFIVILGLILLVVPGVVFATKLQFAGYLVVDKNLGVVEALSQSWQMTRGNIWKLFFYCILLALINILGFIALIVGLLFTVPLTMLATAFVYRKLLLQSKAA
jgi:uncharacterized membrane protein